MPIATLWRYCAVYPPSTAISDPVIHVLSGEARNTTALAMSSGLPEPLNGCWLSIHAAVCGWLNAASVRGVLMKPGQIALTCTRCGAQSIAADFVIPAHACFDAM